MAKNWYPIVDVEKCVSCGLCIDHCKKGVYEKGQKKPNILAPDNCSFMCECCSKLCPVEAISYYSEPTLFKISKGHGGCGH